jgi:hypothetical protein
MRAVFAAILAVANLELTWLSEATGRSRAIARSRAGNSRVTRQEPVGVLRFLHLDEYREAINHVRSPSSVASR